MSQDETKNATATTTKDDEAEAEPQLDPNRDAKFLSRVQSGLKTVQAWDSPENAETIRKIRASLPWDDLYDVTETGPYSQLLEKEDCLFLSSLSPASSSWWEEDFKFVQRLARYFQKTMTWVNSPPCQNCQSTEHMEYVSTLEPPPETEQEQRSGGASRIEVYHCNDCNNLETEFARYNDCWKLFQEKRGRCGEYANLFGLYCRAVGLETRYIQDWTDHVWTEVRIAGQYIMVDSCEGVVNRPSMYEHGWGKNLNVILAFSNHSVVDVTPRYTRKFNSSLLKNNRRKVTTSELALEQTLYQINHQVLWHNSNNNNNKPQNPKLVKEAILSEKALQNLQRRVKREIQELERLKTLDSWNHEKHHHLYEHGRISGSKAWKQARQELGTSTNMSNQQQQQQQRTSTNEDAESSTKETTTTSESVIALKQPPFMPVSRRTTTKNNDDLSLSIISITIDPGAKDGRFQIRRNETPCSLVGVQEKNDYGMSVVVFSPPELGCCLWQTLLVRHVGDLAAYVATLPTHSIVAMTGRLDVATTSSSMTSSENDYTSSWNRLGGFKSSYLSLTEEGKEDNDFESKQTDNEKTTLLYLGQVDDNPSWTVCGKASEYPGGYQITSTTSAVVADNLCLAEYPGVCPTSIVGRLEECSASLSLVQKQAAFWNSTAAAAYPGFVTKLDSPVYLLGNETACPMTTPRRQQQQQQQQQHGSSSNDNDENSSMMWTTCLRLPKSLVPSSHRVDPTTLVLTAPPPHETNTNTANSNQQPGYQVPVDLGFFHSQIGTELVTSAKNRARLPVAVVLENVRLVGLYFSAHWCGPCRSFTPLLAEAYETWKEHSSQQKQHGLELVFCSSDRDPASFDAYSRTMPWPAIPFEALPFYKPALSAMYGIRGIPSLVILDAVSGQVVVSAQTSRNEVMQATRQGGSSGLERLLDDWLVRVPAPTIELLQMLEASCHEHTATSQNEESNLLEQKQRQENLTTDSLSLYLNGTVPEPPLLPLLPGPHDTMFQKVIPTPSDNATSSSGEEDHYYWNLISKSDRKVFLDTVLKYVDNCRASPWVVKYRQFHVNNKVVDRIARIPYALAVLQSSLFRLRVSLLEDDENDDYSISIPVSCNLDQLHDKLVAYQEATS